VTLGDSGTTLVGRVVLIGDRRLTLVTGNLFLGAGEVARIERKPARIESELTHVEDWGTLGESQVRGVVGPRMSTRANRLLPRERRPWSGGRR